MSNHGPYEEYRHNNTKVWARQLTGTEVIKTDRGKVVGHAGDWEIIDEDGTRYVNSDSKFRRNYGG